MDLKQKQVSDQPQIVSTTKGFVLFRGRDSGAQLDYRLSFDETIKDDHIIPLDDGRRLMSSAIIGCVLYDLPADTKNPHQTHCPIRLVNGLPGAI